jgi:mono/diheme cytochrome c family protein
MKKLKFVLVIGCLFFSFLGGAESAEVSEVIEPVLTIKTLNNVKVYTKSDLLKLPGLKSITIEDDPAYPTLKGSGQKITYKLAVPVSSIFKNLEVDAEAILMFKCLDGFSGQISMKRITSQSPDESIAYIAIEDNSWRKLKSDSPATAGPFYLIWENPEKSKIVTEEWPFQLASFEVSTKTLSELFPDAVPTSDIKFGSAIDKGFRSYVTNCSVCHSINGNGRSKIGPDLNRPHSPAEYFKKEFFFKLVRNPQSLRTWPNSRMNGFDEKSLSQIDLENIWTYFNYLSSKKVMKK